jgi:hypothetical protein
VSTHTEKDGDTFYVWTCDHCGKVVKFRSDGKDRPIGWGSVERRGDKPLYALLCQTCMAEFPEWFRG